MNMDGTKELAELRLDFPGVWVRDDGAFALQKPFVIEWEPSWLEARFIAGDYGKGKIALTAHQLLTLANYMSAALDRPASEPMPDHKAPWMYGTQFTPEEIYGHKQAGVAPLQPNMMPPMTEDDA